jgi:hypothetical protein
MAEARVEVEKVEAAKAVAARVVVTVAVVTAAVAKAEKVKVVEAREPQCCLRSLSLLPSGAKGTAYLQAPP